jgi:hypothetical protein
LAGWKLEPPAPSPPPQADASSVTAPRNAVRLRRRRLMADTLAEFALLGVARFG